jgi:hypothetical protein
MKYFYVRITTQYDGYEWVSLDLIEARNEQEATKKAKKTDYTHENGIEVQEIEYVNEIPHEHYQVLNQYI